MSAAVTAPLQNDLSLPRLVPPSAVYRAPRAGRKLRLPPRSERRPHPVGLYVLSLAEAGERFGFYLMLTLFALYLNEQLGFSQARASSFYGSYLAACYALPFVGGWVAGRFVSRRFWVFVGALILASGYFLLALGGSGALMLALGVLAVGNGLFKPNISAQIGNLYTAGDPRRDEAFGIFYLAINIGGLLGPLIGEVLRGRFGFGAAFASAGVALIGSSLTLHLCARHLKAADRLVVVAEEKTSPRRRVAALLLICAALIPFWLAFHQYGSSLTFWARDSVDRTVEVFGVRREIPPGWFAASNSLFVLLLSAPLAALFRVLRGIGSAEKIVAGLLVAAGAFAILGVTTHGAAGLAHPGWLLAYYLVVTTGELLLSPVGLSLTSKLSPPRWIGVLFGLWFVSTALGNWLAGLVGRLWAVWSHARFFGGLSLLLGVTGLLLATQLGWLRRTMPQDR
jgi:POT family proton-dependent oligopeptide transporter